MAAASVVLYAIFGGHGGPGQPPKLEPEGQPSGPVQQVSPPVAIRIPSIKLDSKKLAGASFIPVGLASDGSMEVPDVHKPTAFGYYCPRGKPPNCGAPMPGQVGPSVVVSHVNGDGKKGGFYGLAKVDVGSNVRFNVHVNDIIDIDLADGRTDKFKVTKTLSARKDSFPADQVWGAVNHPSLRLITCGGALDQKAHSYLSNVIVFADLVP